MLSQRAIISCVDNSPRALGSVGIELQAPRGCIRAYRSTCNPRVGLPTPLQQKERLCAWSWRPSSSVSDREDSTGSYQVGIQLAAKVSLWLNFVCFENFLRRVLVHKKGHLFVELDPVITGCL